jgi:hypothetical protein
MENRQPGRAWPAPAFGFGIWLGGRTAGIGPMLAVSPFVYRGARWTRHWGGRRRSVVQAHSFGDSRMFLL